LWVLLSEPEEDRIRACNLNHRTSQWFKVDRTFEELIELVTKPAAFTSPSAERSLASATATHKALVAPAAVHTNRITVGVSAWDEALRATIGAGVDCSDGVAVAGRTEPPIGH